MCVCVCGSGWARRKSSGDVESDVKVKKQGLGSSSSFLVLEQLSSTVCRECSGARDAGGDRNRMVQAWQCSGRWTLGIDDPTSVPPIFNLDRKSTV